MNKSFPILSLYLREQNRLQQLLHRLTGDHGERQPARPVNRWHEESTADGATVPRHDRRIARRPPSPSGNDLFGQLCKLPRHTRQVFLLRRLDGLSYAAIAAQLGVPLEAVEKDMIRALSHCQRVCAGD